MRFEELHDHGRDSIDVWYARLVNFVRVGNFWLDVVRSTFVVVASALVGAVAGGIISAKYWPGGFWASMIFGAILLGLAGWRLARSVFLAERENLDRETSSPDPGLFAPHLPGVQEKFARARKREFALVVVVIASGIFLAYLAKAKPDWPMPAFLTDVQWVAAMLGLFLVFFVLIVANARCPACRGRLRGVLNLRRCPICGIALRD